MNPSPSVTLGIAPAVLGFVLVHATLRRDAAELVHAAASETFSRRVTLVDRVLSVHHRGEEDLLLPEIVERQPGFAPTSVMIEQQHARLDAAVGQLKRCARHGTTDERAAQADEVLRLLEEHLWTEEQRLLPVWQASFTAAELEEFGARLRWSTPVRDMRVMVPWLLEAAPPSFQQLAADHVPPPVRALYRLWWRRRFQREYGFAAA
jgi:hypothetical protein